MALEITLTRGMVAVVDAEDFERLGRFNWVAVEGRLGSFYAHRAVGRAERLPVRSRQMQREVLDPACVVPGSLKADHINGDTLDCRRQNLRWADNTLSNINRRTWGECPYRGVSFNRSHNRWRGAVKIHGVPYIGLWRRTAEAAALDYNRLAIQHHGDKALLNVVPQEGEKCRE